MSIAKKSENCVQEVLNLKVDKAASSLNRFAIAFDNGRGLILEAVSNDGNFEISAEMVTKEELPQLEEAVCTVDWTWIESSKISAVEKTENQVKFSLAPAGPLVVGLGAWEGKPFLSFKPFQPAKKCLLTKVYGPGLHELCFFIRS